MENYGNIDNFYGGKFEFKELEEREVRDTINNQIVSMTKKGTLLRM